MAVISKYECQCCHKQRTYKVTKAEHMSSRRVVCKGCRKNNPTYALALLAEWKQYGPVQESI